MIPIANRFGWRLPSVEELTSLIDQTHSHPALPAGHPFLAVSNIFYWTATPSQTNPSAAWAVLFSDGAITTADKLTPGRIWCVRGGSGPQNNPSGPIGAALQ